MSAQRTKRIFLSAAGADAAWGDRIDRLLSHADGFEVVYYRRSFPQGSNFIAEMNSALSSCDCMVALLSPAYCDPASWVTEEWQAAMVIAKRRPGFLALFLIEQCRLPPLLAPLSYINLTPLSEEAAGDRVLAELQGRDWTRTAVTGARGPADSTWVAAIHRFGQDRLPLGAGVVIDERRVLTCAQLVTENGKVLDPLPSVSFPMALLAGSQHRQVTGVRLSDDVFDLALLELDKAVPAGVRPAPLRRPKPDYLTERAWWAFGFPDQEEAGDAREYGGHADGEIDAILTHEVLGLAADTRDAVRAGFCGAGLWSPDYEAVTGIVSHVDSRGTGRAVTLYQADVCFGSDRLSALMTWSADQAGEVAVQAWGCAPTDGRYRFQGRSAALSKIVGWLDQERPDRRALLVTGSPGAGKSTVLGRIVATADPAIRATLPSDDRAVRATEGSLACAVHAKGKTALEVAQEIARAFSAQLPPLTGELGSLAPAVSDAAAEQGRKRVNIVIDALDEASTPADARSIITQIVRPLLRVGVQVVVGSRRRDDAGDIPPAFRDAVVTIDLDAPAYYSPEDVKDYALSVLQQRGAERGPDNPYADDQAGRRLAARIAELSRGNFLVAGLTARSHADYDQEAADPAQLAAFAADAEDALYQALEQVLERGGREAAGMPVPTALTALTALAFAEAPGLSGDLWSAAVESLPGEPVPVRLSDLRLARLARSAAGSFIAETSGPDGTAVFGLFHQALNDALLYRRAQRTTSLSHDPIKEDQQALTRGFLRYGHEAGWASAPAYLLRSLARHAELAGLLDELLADDGYLLYADLQRLTPLAALASTEAGQEQARLLRLTPYAVHAGPQPRRALFSVTEALERLGDTFRGSSGPAPYRATWSTTATHLERAAQEGHTGGVTEVCTYIAGGRTFLASAGEDEMVRVWDYGTGGQRQVLEGHSGAVWSVCGFTAPSGQVRLASAGADAMVRIWDPATGDQLLVLEGHSGPVWSVCKFTAADRQVLLATAGADGTLRVWDPATGDQQQLMQGHSGAINGVHAFTLQGQALLASASADETVRVWDPATGGERRVLEGHTGAVKAVCAFTDNGRVMLASASADETVRVWDLATGEEQRVLEGHTSVVGAVCAFTAGHGRTLLASGSDDETVRLWDPATGLEHGRPMAGYTGGAWSVCAFSCAGRTLLAAAGGSPEIYVWDPAAGQRERMLAGSPGSVWSVCSFSSGDRQLLAAAGDDEAVSVRDPATGEPQRVLTGHTGGAWSVCTFTSGDGRPLLAAASHDAKVRIWDPATGQLQKEFDCGTDKLWSVCALTSGARTLLATAGNDSVVRVWDPATGRLEQSLAGHKGTVWWTCALPSPDGRTLLVSVGDDRKVMIWDPVTGDRQQEMLGHGGGIWSVCTFASADGRTLLASGGDDRKVLVWDPVTGEQRNVLEGHTGAVWSVCAFAAGGRTLLASCADDADVRIWDPATAQALQTIPVHLAPHVIGEVAGRLVVGLSAGLLAIELDLGR